MSSTDIRFREQVQWKNPAVSGRVDSASRL